MRIRRCASRLLGSASSASAPSQSELPPPPPAHESQAGFVAASATSSSSPLEPCKLSVSPWDLMDQLHLSDPQAEKIFLETYFVAVAWRASWLFQPSMPAAGSIKDEEQQQEVDMALDVVDSVTFELHVRKKNASRNKARNKNGIKPNINKEKIEAKKSDATAAGGETPVPWTCKKKSGKSWFCWRPVSQPNSFCSYHSDQKPKRKRAADMGEGFFYYAGFGSRSKRQRIIPSSSDGVPEPAAAARKEETLPNPEEHIGFTKPQAQADGADHQQPAASVYVDKPKSDHNTVAIAGCDEESSDDDVVVEPRDIKTKSPLKKRWRKPIKARSLKSLMY